MASLTGSAISVSAPISLSLPRPIKASNGSSTFASSLSFGRNRSFPSSLRLSVSCAAKKETVDKVCEIVRNQLALAPEIDITGESEFSKLGADSLDTVEIVMGLEESFEITVDEGSAQDIKTVHDAAEMIEKLVGSKSA